MNRNQKVKDKKKRRRKKSIITFIVFVLLVIGSYSGYLVFQTYQAANKAYNDLGREKSDKREVAATIDKDPISILIMGIEDYSSGGANGRTDSLMVATFNPDDGRLKLLSIPRDTLVDIVGYDKQDKINHAHVWGGKKMTIDTVENLLDIPIDYYAAVDFEAFISIIDILGGVTVDVPFDFSQKTMAPGSRWVEFYEGEMHLTGEEALAFARMRKQDPRGDIGRGERQQEVVKAVIDNVFSVGTLTKVDKLAITLGENIETNMKISDGLAFVKEYSDFNTSKIDQLKLDTYEERINGGSYQIADPESLLEVQTILKQHLELE